MRPDQTIAIVVPTPGEFEPYRALLPDLRRLNDAGAWDAFEASAGGRRLVFILSAAGPVNAAAAGERLITQYAPRVMLHGGSAGAHHPNLLPGDVVIGSRYVIATSRAVQQARVARGLHPSLIRFRRHGQTLNLDYIDAHAELLACAERLARQTTAGFGQWQSPGWPPEMPRRPGHVVTGIVASADAWTVDPDELRMLHEDFGAECEDMESAYLAQVCAIHELPFVAVRVISDNEAACQLTAADVAPAVAEAGARAAAILTALASEAPLPSNRSMA